MSTANLFLFSSDPGAIVEAQTSVPYAIVGGILALLVFLVICVLIVMVWCSIRQKGQCNSLFEMYLLHLYPALPPNGLDPNQIPFLFLLSILCSQQPCKVG